MDGAAYHRGNDPNGSDFRDERDRLGTQGNGGLSAFKLAGALVMVVALPLLAYFATRDRASVDIQLQTHAAAIGNHEAAIIELRTSARYTAETLVKQEALLQEQAKQVAAANRKLDLILARQGRQ